jgi:hypothetical protein
MEDIFKKDYKLLTEETKKDMETIKLKAQELMDAIYESNRDGYTKKAIDISRIKLEEAVMWAIKAIT